MATTLLVQTTGFMTLGVQGVSLSPVDLSPAAPPGTRGGAGRPCTPTSTPGHWFQPSRLRSTRSHFTLRRPSSTAHHLHHHPTLHHFSSTASGLTHCQSAPIPLTSLASAPSSVENAAARPSNSIAAKRSRSSLPDRMATAAKNFFHGIGHNAAHPHLPRSSNHKSQAKKDAERDRDPEYQRRKEEEKALICSWDSENKAPLSFDQICKPVNEKRLGHSSKSLERKDFKLIKTVGTGTFARVWLAKLAQPASGDEDKVFALKVLRKADIIKLKQVEHVRSERTILAQVSGHPFITTLMASFQDADNLYMILDYIPGGEIFSYLRRNRRFDEEVARFYAAELALVLQFLHEREGMAYRDLKPENILLDGDGHLKLVDFGFAKKLDGKSTWTLCGTPEYLAPETIKNTGHGPPVDWWSFGILLYEFIVGQPPFWDENPMKIYEQIVDGNIHYPNGMSEEAQDLITKLCEINPAKRLGNLSGGAKDVQEHAFFKNVDWDKLYRREVPAPINPNVQSHDDTSHFENYDLEPERKTVYTPDLRKKYDSMFESF